MADDDFIDHPVLKRMFEIAASIEEGAADPELVEQWNGMREAMVSAVKALTSYLEPYPVEDHEELTRKLVGEVIREKGPYFPQVH